ncbi:hypothetical protein ACLEIY_15925 [Acetobacter tropicalis]|uniref:hypothetical protein n=1 Tax=Acetobacter tropicalis TaxID=104102 RepID=UPI0039750638
MTDPRIEAAARAMFDRSKAEVLAAKGFTSSYDYGEISEKDKEYWRDMIRPIIAAADAAAWRPMSDAPRDRTEILAKTRPDVYPETHNRSGWNNRSVVIRHEGIVNDDFDMGWSVAAPVGYGGMPDKWFVGWQPLPAPPASIDALGGVDG